MLTRDPVSLQQGFNLFLQIHYVDAVKKVLVNFVPAAAVIRRAQALSLIIGHKGYVGGLSS